MLSSKKFERGRLCRSSSPVGKDRCPLQNCSDGLSQTEALLALQSNPRPKSRRSSVPGPGLVPQVQLAAPETRHAVVHSACLAVCSHVDGSVEPIDQMYLT